MAKRVFLTIAIIILVIVLVVGGYVAYVMLSYYRIGNVDLTVEGTATEQTAKTGTPYTLATYNIGFGAYQQEYDCVLDTSLVPDSSGNWVETSGTHLKALSAEDAQRNTQGAADTLASQNVDFAYVQEADTDSNRCYGINQVQKLQQTLPGMQSTYAQNFHTPYLFYPPNDPMGVANSGILTLSKFQIQSAQRYEFVVTNDLIAKQFDLDRCSSASYVNVENGKQLVLVNLHMSAYDEGGQIRNKQRIQLYDFMASEYAKGNYVVVGGDFNHDLVTNNPDYPQYTSDNLVLSETYTGKANKNVVPMFDDSKSAGLPDGFKIIASANSPTNREAAIAWNPGYSFVTVLDGFIVSANVEVLSHANVTTTSDAGIDGFAYSDHEPACIEFRLK